MDSFKKYIKEELDNDRKSISKKKHLLKHTVLIQAQEGDSVKGTKSRINIKSLNDCNIIGYVTYNSYEDALSTFERLTNLDEIVEFLQRNSHRFPTSADWSYIVRDEIDMRDNLDPQMPQAPEGAMGDPEGVMGDPEGGEEEEPEEEPQEDVMNG